jgi:uncharacterized protein YjcR
MPKFEWNNQHERAAELLAEGELTNAAICSQLGIAPSTLRNWKNRPEFAERVEVAKAYITVGPDDL